MAQDTAIEWADDTANFWEGCTQISPACDLCYAKERAERYGTVEWNGPPRKVKAGVKTLRDANKRAQAEGRVRLVFINSLSDIFDKNANPQWRRELFDEVKRAPWIVALFLTKRIGNAVEMSEAAGGWPANAALGITVINQEEAERDIPKQARAKAAMGVRWAFLSIEPMLGPIDLSVIEAIQPTRGVISSKPIRVRGIPPHIAGVEERCAYVPSPIDAVIVGGESGREARPMHHVWIREVRDWCQHAEIAFHFKQWGEWRWAPEHAHFKELLQVKWRRVESDMPNVPPALMVRFDKKENGRVLDGRTHDAFLPIDRSRAVAA